MRRTHEGRSRPDDRQDRQDRHAVFGEGAGGAPGTATSGASGSVIDRDGPAVAAAPDVPAPTFSSQWHRAVGWEVGSQLCRFGLQLLSFVVVSRVLDPAQLGTMTLFVMAYTVVLTLYDTALVNAVLRRTDFPVGERVAESMVLGGSIGIVLAVGALALAVWYPAGWPAGPAAPACLVPALLLTGTNSGHTAEMLRARRHRDLAVVEVVAAVSGTIVSLGLLIVVRQFWALFVGFGVNQAAKCLVLFVMLPARRLGLRLNGRARRSIARTTITPGAAELLSQFARNADYLAMALTVGTTQLGAYTRAFQFSSFPGQFLGSAANRAAQGAFAVRRELDDERRRLLAAARSNTALATVASVGLVVAGPWVFRLAVGPGFGDLAPVIRVLALVIPIRANVSVFNGYLMVHRPIAIVASTATVGLVIFGGVLAVAGNGLVYVAAAVVLGAQASAVVMAVGLHRVVSLAPWRALLPELAGVTLTAAVAAALTITHAG